MRMRWGVVSKNMCRCACLRGVHVYVFMHCIGVCELLCVCVGMICAVCCVYAVQNITDQHQHTQVSKCSQET
ncbi:hypothetical protein EON63_06535 [archaeon]|nr:MAG: hypothetical protein EON63_06535 [archaeon]